MSVRMALVELEEWRLWRPDIIKAYRATYATKRLRINDDLRFGEQERRDCLMDFGFKPCPHEANIYVREVGDDYDYAMTYMDDTCLVINRNLGDGPDMRRGRKRLCEDDGLEDGVPDANEADEVRRILGKTRMSDMIEDQVMPREETRAYDCEKSSHTRRGVTAFLRY